MKLENHWFFLPLINIAIFFRASLICICFIHFKNLKNDIKVIFSIDRKQITNDNNATSNGNSTSWTQNEIEEFIEKEFDNYENITYFYDVNSYIKSFQFFLLHNKNSLIGSDVQNWDEYKKRDSNDLLSYNKLIRSFDDLFFIFKNKECYETFKKLGMCHEIDNLPLYEISKKSETSIKKSETSITIPNLKIIEYSMNVIFGPKSSGKTSLLISIKEWFKEKSNDQECCLYIPTNNSCTFFKNFKSKWKKFANEINNKLKNHFDNINECVEALNNLYKKPKYKFADFVSSTTNNKEEYFKLIKAKITYSESNIDNICKHYLEQLKD